jgi:hypothetical protein
MRFMFTLTNEFLVRTIPNLNSILRMVGTKDRKSNKDNW